MENLGTIPYRYLGSDSSMLLYILGFWSSRAWFSLAGTGLAIQWSGDFIRSSLFNGLSLLYCKALKPITWFLRFMLPSTTPHTLVFACASDTLLSLSDLLASTDIPVFIAATIAYNSIILCLIRCSLPGQSFYNQDTPVSIQPPISND